MQSQGLGGSPIVEGAPFMDNGWSRICMIPDVGEPV